MFGTFSKNESEARKFWAEAARGGVEYEDNHSTTVLDAWLKAAIESKSESAIEARAFLPGLYLRVECLS